MTKMFRNIVYWTIRNIELATESWLLERAGLGFVT
jgi:hypothetical protein